MKSTNTIKGIIADIREQLHLQKEDVVLNGDKIWVFCEDEETATKMGSDFAHHVHFVEGSHYIRKHWEMVLDIEEAASKILGMLY